MAVTTTYYRVSGSFSSVGPEEETLPHFNSSATILDRIVEGGTDGAGTPGVLASAQSQSSMLNFFSSSKDNPNGNASTESEVEGVAQ